MMFDKKQIQTTFLFKFKMDYRAVETTRNINAFGPVTANEHTVQWWFKKFCKADESLEDEEQKLTVTNWVQVFGADPLKTTREVAKKSTSTIVQSLNILSKLERWKR